jgi:predicted HTH transcriptional regulator
MPIDLYTTDFAPLTGTQLYDAIVAFARINQPQDDRPQEGYMLDFKEEWGEKSLRVVAAFANTFGGIVLVGVTEQMGKAGTVAGAVKGVSSASELKTKIAGSIGANISPSPIYQIAECQVPNDPQKRICVIRVRVSGRIHYLLKKNESPVYIRNEDQAIPAPAAELRQLVEREKALVGDRSASEKAVKPIFDRLTITKASGAGTFAERLKDRTKANSSLKIAVTPQQTVSIPLDYGLEQEIDRIIASSFSSFRRRNTRRRSLKSGHSE